MTPSEAGRGAAGIVGIGASAGGIPALRAFLEAIPDDTDLAYVVVMHLSPNHESKLAEVLQPSSRIPVRQVAGRTLLEANHVYVIPPDRSLAVTDGHLTLSDFEEPRGGRAPIDTFFRTLARTHAHAIGILLSGAGTDGVVGLKALKEGGGIVMAQSPVEAEYDSMPRSAIATGVVDFVLSAREIGERVVALRGRGSPWSGADNGATLEDGGGSLLEDVIAELRARTGHDFGGYKKTTVLRRVARRMQITGNDAIEDYLDHLRRTVPEAAALQKDLLISVTNFFRDPDTFATLGSTVVPALFDLAERDPDGGGLRVWVAGCATGDEAYSVAMLLAEHAGTLSDSPRIQVFATDLAEDAVAIAREGLYPDAIAADVPRDRIARFFHREGAYLRVRKELREMVLFAPHDLLCDPPFSRLHLVLCRNLLIYFERELQERVVDLFRYALLPDGYLFLGESESLPEASGFRVHDRQHRLYQRVQGTADPPMRTPELPLTARGQLAGRKRPLGTNERDAGGDAALHRAALEAVAPPSILVDAQRTILHVSETANRYLRFPAGSPSANLLKAVDPALSVELRSALFQALDRSVSARTRAVPVRIDGEDRSLQAVVAPTSGRGDTPMALVTLLEDGAAPPPDSGTSESAIAGRLHDSEAELSTTRTRLQDLVETSEHRQEELKASNEELQSVNEEYKSTLEELETSREELQSMNEELNTVNDELRTKVRRLGQANDDLRNLMHATEVGTLFLDREFHVQRYTPALTRLFNILPVDKGRPIEHVTHSMRYPDLRADCEAVLASLQPVQREVQSEDGDLWLVRITPYRTTDDRISGIVATFTDVTLIREAQREVGRSEERFRALVDATAETVWTTAPDGARERDSPSWLEFTGQSDAGARGWGWLDAVHPDDRTRAEEEWRRTIETGAPGESEFRVRHDGSDEWRVMAVRSVPVKRRDGSIREWVGMSTDITLRRRAEEELRSAKVAAEEGAEAKSQFLATMSHELRTPLNAIIALADILEAERDGPATDGQKSHVSRIKTSAWHLVSIIDEVLSYTRATSGHARVHRGSVDVASIARDVVMMMELSTAPKSLTLELLGADRPVYALTDGGKLRQVLTNLIGNAVKFTDEGGVAVELTSTEEHVAFEVRDTGPGIPESELEHIFEAFIQVDSSPARAKEGAGLGLAVSRRLARLLGGEVTVASEVGAGSAFEFWLPRQAEAEGEEGADGGSQA